ncbi:hypothetical protein [Absidia glauca]|uniref:Uncharacterized protein n=1 Tax=Absidia glauca TaxID=4829 RepID=A0A168RPM0_ABSGL|nr:hypothetical protein [Absidia glauca]
MDVAYISRIAPMLHIEEPSGGKRNSDNDSQDEEDRPRHRKRSARNRSHAHKYRKQDGKTSTFEECKAQGICFYCKNKWSVGHTCQAYRDRQPRNYKKYDQGKSTHGNRYHFNRTPEPGSKLKQRIAKIEEQLNAQEVMLNMRDLNMNKKNEESECK